MSSTTASTRSSTSESYSYSADISNSGSEHGGSSGPSFPGDVPYIKAYDALLNTYLQPFVELSFEYGGHLKSQAVSMQKAFVLLGKFLVTASQVEGNPDVAQAAPLYRSLFNAMRQVEELRVVKQHSRWASHMSAIAEGAHALGWVQERDPSSRLYLARKGVEFYLKFIKRNFKNEPRTKKWVKALHSLMKNLHKYVNQWHVDGVDWGGAAAATRGSEPSASDASGAFYDDVIIPGAKGDDDSRSGSSRGSKPSSPSAVTPYVPIKAVDTPSLSTLNSSLNVSSIMLFGKAPVAEQVGHEWVVENHHHEKTLEIVDAEADHVLVIRNCHSCTITVLSPTIGYVLMEDCNKTQLVMTSASDGIELVNCRSIVVTASGSLPIVDMEKCAGVVITLNQQALNEAAIYSSACANIRIAYVTSDQGNDVLVEKTIPNRFLTRVNTEEATIVTHAVYKVPERKTRQGVKVVQKLLQLDVESNLDDVE